MSNTHKIKIEKINLREALRYMGYRGHEPEENIMTLLLSCERELLEVIDGRLTYRIFDLKDGQPENINFVLKGDGIKRFLKGCEKAAFMCATVSSGVDDLIRRKQLTGMTEAMAVDAMASAAVEQVCDEAMRIMKSKMPGYKMTGRFGLGYSDFPLEGQKDFLNILDAQKRIGVCVNDSMLLVPSKSVTCVVGFGKNPACAIKDVCHDGESGCNECNMSDECSYNSENKN